MATIDFNNKTFSLIDNSENGKVNADTIFEYKQQGHVVTADYYGGTVTYGKIIAILKDDILDMRYQCITSDNQLKTGKAIATISTLENGKIKLALNWEWLDDSNAKGTSVYLEH
ncbi:n-acetylglutamate synthase [uncultured Psychroserpens sp.]|uniref:n-acetylglutamate synthase n=1 Tax=uncultured Psychroserpens sp. TaxID=255436 RepID=UPI00260946E1|nr:n-acetylglutamate synthase [uncultured Psychroserpens sp.]